MSENKSISEQSAGINTGKESENVNVNAEDVTKSTSLLDSWFIRCCWSYKKDFLFRCLDHFCREGLEQVVLLLGPPIKDYYYSLSGYTNNQDDIIPQDDNRQLDENILNQARETDLIWLLSLPRQQAINILIGLTELSGSALRMQLYERALSLLKESENQETDISEIQVAPKEKYGLSEDVNKETREYHSFKISLNKYNHFIDKLKGKLNMNQEDKKNNQKRLSKVDANNNKNQEALDYLQILPSWINRQVLSYLDEDTLNKCQKVNSYWKNAVKELQKERDTRKKIDELTTKLQPIDIDAVKPGKGEKNEKNKKTSTAKTQEDPKKAQKKLGNRVSDSEKRVSMLPRSESDTEEMIKCFMKSKNRLAFRHQYLLVWTLDEYTDVRVLALGKRWLAFSRSSTIVLCNLITFANMPGLIKGHEGKITAMVFHPKDAHLISSGTDSVVRRWEVWSRQEVHHLNFPDVTDIKANENYYVVAGARIIKVFRWELNMYQCSVELEEPNSVNTLAITQNHTIFMTYSTENTIRRFCAKNGVTLWEISKTQCSKITCIYQTQNYLVTANEDGLVIIWKTNIEPIMLANRNFSKRINDVILQEGCIIAAGDQGELYIWDVATDEIIQTLIINEDSMPLVNLRIINYQDHCKVVINSEMGIKILQFLYEKKDVKKKGAPLPQTCRSLPSALQSSEKMIVMRKKKKENKAKERLIKMQSCHPNLRKEHKTILTIKDSAEYLLRQDIGDMRYFPAIYGDWIKPLVEFKDLDKEEVVPLKTKQSKSGNQQSNLMELLPIHNPYKRQF